MINILFVHQSAELYGSDKTLLLLLQNLDRSRYFPIVILPNDGPLSEKLIQINIKVHLVPVLKLHRKMFTPSNIILFTKQIGESIKAMDILHKKYNFDLVYSNTLAVLLGIIFAYKRNIKHIWHIHEIIETPLIFKVAFQKMLALKSNSFIVYNSAATQFFWNINNNIKNKSVVIKNGQELSEINFSEEDKIFFRESIFKVKSEIIIALVGRISKLKGQLILLKAYEIILKKYKGIKLVFIGSAPSNQNECLEILQHEINQRNLENNVIIIPFQEDITLVWQSIDIAVVPSIVQESFGLVALEAMLAKKPVIASNHGGLAEIVVDKQTGFLVPHSDEIALANALEQLIINPEIRIKFGINGYERAKKVFSVEQYVNSFEDLFNKMILK